MTAEIAYLARADAPRLAYRHRPGFGPTLFYLPGYYVSGLGSDMEGTKARAVDEWAAARGQAALRFDYRGCGASDGDFLEGTIGRWTQDALAVVDAAEADRVVLIGSSLGGWTALLAARALGPRVAGLVLLAPAPDFTRWDLVATMTDGERAALVQRGYFERADTGLPTPTRYSRALIEDGARHMLLGQPIAVRAPVRVLHGQSDPVVPWRLSLEIAEHIASDDVQVILIKDGDHRLSRPADLALLTGTLEALLSRCTSD